MWRQTKRAILLSRISRLLESRHDFSTVDEQLTDQDKQALQVWEVVNQKEEVAQVAKSIRQLLADGKRYKDILVLLGDEESYKLQVGQIFRKFDIPYYFGRKKPCLATLWCNLWIRWNASGAIIIVLRICLIS